MRFATTALVMLLLPTAAAHGDLAVNELETLAIRDFEGMEDSFPWEGFEIWDVYVGEGYNASYDMDGVYFKVNFAGDGTKRPTGGQAWTVTFQFNVGEEVFERQFTHDGTTISTTFESLQWMVADGNVLQVKAWVPIEDWKGRAVTDVVIVSDVDGEPRDTAPGGIHSPGGAEAPVQAPSTPIFPPLGEGRMVDEVSLTGPGKYLNVSLAPAADGAFALIATNPLKEQGQHVTIHAMPAPAWNLSANEWGANLDGGASTTFDLTLRTKETADSLVAPLRVDLVSDIGGRQTYYAFLGASGVEIVSDATAAHTASLSDLSKDTPIPTLFVLLAAIAVALVLRSRPRS